MQYVVNIQSKMTLIKDGGDYEVPSVKLNVSVGCVVNAFVICTDMFLILFLSEIR